MLGLIKTLLGLRHFLIFNQPSKQWTIIKCLINIPCKMQSKHAEDARDERKQSKIVYSIIYNYTILYIIYYI